MIEPSNLIELPSSIELKPKRLDRSLKIIKKLENQVTFKVSFILQKAVMT